MMARHRQRLAAGTVLLGLVGLSGCGGGGGEPPVPAPAPAPVPAAAADPFYANQWHLDNSAQSARLVAGEDINVEPAWEAGIKGSGVLLVVVDDGLEIAHEDLAANVAAGKSWDYLDSDHDPTSVHYSHGTQVAGLAAARDLNGVGGRGVAPRAALAGYNLLADAFVSSTRMSDAMTRNHDEVAVSSNSWGISTDGDGVTEAPDTLWQDGVVYGTEYGRNGKGTVYVWAAGNGGEFGVDNSNYDFMANNRHVMAVCAVDGGGVKASYSEEGANLWLCAPGGEYNGLTTTDLTGIYGDNAPGAWGDYGNYNYTGRFAGTSAATPIVAGVVALLLEANPGLGWRDVRLILAETARKNDLDDTAGWSETKPALGQPQYHINHKYGFGVVDAAAAVERAKGWTNVGSQTILDSAPSLPVAAIPDNDPAGVVQSVTVGAGAGMVIEYVEVEVSIVHGDPGDLEIVLTAPSGTQSILAQVHTCATLANACPVTNYSPWTFGSSRHLGEGSAGQWSLKVADKRANDLGSLTSWKLRIYGRQP